MDLTPSNRTACAHGAAPQKDVTRQKSNTVICVLGLGKRGSACTSWLMVHADSSRPAAQQTLHSHGPPRVHASACAVARATPPACPLGGWGLGIVHHGGKQLRTPVLLQCGELIVRVVRNNKEGVKVASGLAQASVSWRVRGPVPGRPPGRDRRCPGGCTTGRTHCVSLALNTC